LSYARLHNGCNNNIGPIPYSGHPLAPGA